MQSSDDFDRRFEPGWRVLLHDLGGILAVAVDIIAVFGLVFGLSLCGWALIVRALGL